MTQYFWSSKILIILSAIKLHILKLIFRSYCKNHITGSHILLNDTFDLHFCTLILFSVITLDFTTNFLSALKLQSGIVSFLFISYHDAITPGPSLSLAPPVSGGSNSSYTASNESHCRSKSKVFTSYFFFRFSPTNYDYMFFLVLLS